MGTLHDPDITAVSERVLEVLKVEYPSWKPGTTKETIFHDEKTGCLFTVTLWQMEARTDLGFDI